MRTMPPAGLENACIEKEVYLCAHVLTHTHTEKERVNFVH